MENKFDKEKFSNILYKISTSYSNISEFARQVDFDRSYISKYINKKLNNPPTPKILKEITQASHGITTYEELMEVCGYIQNTTNVTNSLTNNTDSFFTVPVFINKEGKLKITEDDVVLPFSSDKKHQYFGYKSDDNTMSPLLGIGDIAIIEKADKYENGNTCLISIDDKTIFIRKILDFKDYIELHTFIPYYQPIKLTKEDIIKRNFKILGKVIKAENESAFK